MKPITLQLSERPIQYQMGSLLVGTDEFSFCADGILFAVQGQNVVIRWGRMPAIYAGERLPHNVAQCPLSKLGILHQQSVFGEQHNALILLCC